MEELGDVDLKHERPNHYGPPPPNHLHRMPLPETPALHNYPPPQSQGANMPPPAPAWNPTPSPYSEPGDHRPHPQDLAHPPPYPGPSQQYPPSGRETPAYHPPHPDSGYGRPGSVSGPTRSPAEPQHPPYHPVSNSHDPAYYPQTPAEYRPRHAYSGPESQPNGTHQQPLHVATGHEMMQGQTPGQPGPYGPHSAGPPPSTPYYYPEFGGGQRRKPVRAAQACDSCRQRKAKCDEGRPECQHCKENALKCSYREIPPQKSEKQVLAITAQLESLVESVKFLADTQRAQGEKIDLLVHRNSPGAMNSHDAATPDERKENVLRSIKKATPGQSTHFQREDSSEVRTVSQTLGLPAQTSKTHNSASDSFEVSLPAQRTTAAQYLLRWPSIQALVPPGIETTFPIDLERGRGLLRLYGQGEGEDKGDGHEGAPSPSGSTSSDGRRLDDEMSATPHGVWGTGQLHALPGLATQSHSAREHPGGISPHGGLMLDAEAVDKNFRHFMDNIHILHPFLEPKVLRIMIHTFKRKYSWDYRATQTGVVVGGKRKREHIESPGMMDDQNTPEHVGSRTYTRGHNSTVPMIEHSIANAIVLLVLALGKVTSYREPLPGPVPATNMRTSTPHSTMYSDLPMPMSAPTSPFNNQVGLNGVNHVNAPSPANPQLKNMDVIPGLAYYAKATDIIGECSGGTDVTHIQANLLAALYMGQLARIMPSYEFIAKACHAAQVLIESQPYVQNTMKPARRNLVNFAFWSCLQMESDIIAELDLPVSGITRFESSQHSNMPTPITLEKIPEFNAEDDILRYYSYQIQLRLTMNSIHSTLYYSPKNQPRNHKTRASDTMMQALNENLEDWRRMLNDWDWDDNDYESPNINVARMRAKYYGAKYILWRPALAHALIAATDQKRERSSESPSGYGESSELTSPAMANVHPPGRLFKDLHPILLEGSKLCVEAAIRSTTVFDKVPRRLVVTNIFGTAHAQWGNTLVLYATYTSQHPYLSSLVNIETLKRLHDRTVSILRENENISPILAQDLKILEHVRRKVFPPTSSSYPPGSTVSSFSSR